MTKAKDKTRVISSAQPDENSTDDPHTLNVDENSTDLDLAQHPDKASD